MKIIQPVSGPWLTSREEVRLQLKNVGADTIQEFSISVGVDELPLVEESISIPIYPGIPGGNISFCVARSLRIGKTPSSSQCTFGRRSIFR